MKKSFRLVALFAMLAVLLGLSGCNKLRARDQLNKGVAAYKSAKFDTAIRYFERAVELDPNLTNARLYLAVAHRSRFVPGIDTPDNDREAQLAIDSFNDVLQRNPKDVNALKNLASLYFDMKKFDMAKEYHRKVLAIDPNDPEEHYSIGVIDWTEAYAPRMEKRAAAGLKPDEPLKDKKLCSEIRDMNQDKVEDGIKELREALKLRPDYDDAMAYLNLMYRERADYECENPEQRAADLATADEWQQKTLATRKAKAERAGQQGGIVLNQ